MRIASASPFNLESSSKWGAWTILLTGILLSAFAAFYVAKKNQNEDWLRFEYEKDSFLSRFEGRMMGYEGALIQTRAFLLNSTDVEIQELQGYIKDTELFKRFPGLQGLGYSMIINPKNLESHLREIRKIMPFYKVWPESENEIYTSIIVLEPTDWRNKRAIGYDMFSEPLRREAMATARDQNRAIMTRKVVLVQEKEGEKLPGFNLYLPHYKKGSKISTLEERRKNIVGYVYSPFRAPELFKAIASDIDMKLDVEVFEGNKISTDNIFFNYDGKFSSKEYSGLASIERININGRNLTFRFSTLPTFEKASSIYKNFFVFLFGTLITLFLTWVYILSRKQILAMKIIAAEQEKLLHIEKEHVAARDDFLSIASHELKTPLTSLKLQSQVMMRSIKRNDPEALSHDKVTHLIKQIDNQTSRLTRLVDDMLDISRIRTGRLKMQKEEVDVSEIILEVIERLHPQFIKVTGNAPDVQIDGKITACWDRFRIEQVLTNLFTNAIRYGNEKPIQVKVAKNKELVSISVIDQGIGIAPENVDRIFDRFERAGMSASEVSGLGLGLFITNQIVKAHGGNIDVTSTTGKGSTFTVNLPASNQNESSGYNQS